MDFLYQKSTVKPGFQKNLCKVGFFVHDFVGKTLVADVVVFFLILQQISEV